MTRLPARDLNIYDWVSSGLNELITGIDCLLRAGLIITAKANRHLFSSIAKSRPRQIV